MVGFCEVPQQTPRAVMVAPPSEVTLPPQVAEELVMSLIGSVVTVGNCIGIVVAKVRCSPYAVPALFVA